MSEPERLIMSADDWQGYYEGGRLVYETHNVADWVVTHLGVETDFSPEFQVACEKTGRAPERWPLGDDDE